MWMSDGRDCAGELRQSLSVEDVDGKQDSLSYYIERITAAKGFKAAAAAAEIKYKGRTDMAMVYSEVPCVAAGTFTTNVVKAAPVKWDQDIVYNHPSAQVVICNSGIANACTGAEGYVRRLQMRLLRFLGWLLTVCWLLLQV